MGHIEKICWNNSKNQVKLQAQEALDLEAFGKWHSNEQFYHKRLTKISLHSRQKSKTSLTHIT